ncbi:MAG: hypothetical protein HIU82_21595 [Proteobacteria bacterium]|nr:hypothetical protein [Pseudomonadota bacterium]
MTPPAPPAAPRRPFAAHADWSTAPAKRWIATAEPAADGWRLAAPAPVGDVATLLDRLRVAAAGAPVALGVDFPLGLPRAFAAARPEADFPAFLAAVAERPDFFSVCAELAEVGPERPFYPMRGRRGMTRAAHAAALGLPGPEALSRACDRATARRPAGAPLFWTLGANQTGKAAIAAWRGMLLPALAAAATGTAAASGGAPAPRLWPFAGPFRSLLAPGAVAIAETYPAEALRQLGLRLTGSKRRQADRAALAGPLHAAIEALGAQAEPGLDAAIGTGFGGDPAGEDRFDCLLGVLSVLAVLTGARPDTAPADPWIQRWEGWVLGQTDLPARPWPAQV